MKASLGNDSATIGARVREARLLRDLGSNELGRLAGMGGGEVSQIENGVRPRPGVFAIARLADAGVDGEALRALADRDGTPAR